MTTAQAPYVGRPFVYRWRDSIDDEGHIVVQDFRIVLANDDFTFCDGPFEYAWGARNGHDPDTPVWP